MKAEGPNMNEPIICHCLWPAHIYDTITGHAPNCPVEETTLAERKVAFTKTIELSDDLDKTVRARVLATLSEP